MPAKKIKDTSEPNTLKEAIEWFSNEDAAHKYLAERRWPDGEVACPTCGGKAVLYMSKYRRWKCANDHARRQFSVKVGTVMEDSPLKVGTWLAAMWMVANCKNGVSSYEIHRALDVTQKSAWFMLARIRLAMQTSQDGGTLDGTIEVDETYVGGKARNMHKGSARRAKQRRGRSREGKAVVMGLLRRTTRNNPSQFRAQVVQNVKRGTLHAIVRDTVEEGSAVYSDALKSYLGLEQGYDHRVIDHAVEYVRGQVHTNGAENFWSLLKRAIKGTYVSVEPFHLFRYVDEQVFRFNERKDEMGDRGRFNTLLNYVAGKRLTYKQLIALDEPSAPALA
jgi:transposase-like protein